MQKTINEAKRIGAFYDFNTFAQNSLTNNFESTCFEDDIKKPAEIIEFPVVILDSVTGTLIDSFQSFVKPTENPELSVFCSNLTGIQQCDVENAPTLAVVLRKFEHWLRKAKENLGCSFKGQPTSAIFVTWTDWDISTCLWDECRRKKLPLPGDMLNRIDLKAIFQQWLGSHKIGQKWRGGLKDALNLIGLHFEGRPHRGIDDARNTSRLLLHLLSKNVLNFATS
ncbi:3'-5' exonuclease eri1-related [Schistosoma mansoni]|uniref:3'-5' exonuclease eri1-related n=1 Tax=Schistosoma mansoni TaxID=6183 RepID=UPI0001A64216|nr:3'-5' exonuclease eri1-related [Schistosoma mansoni]|eukprot:XP_018646145.1 3'-5' exonuclease eri1-related [Schistosoma mansoni]